MPLNRRDVDCLSVGDVLELGERGDARLLRIDRGQRPPALNLRGAQGGEVAIITTENPFPSVADMGTTNANKLMAPEWPHYPLRS